MGGGDGAILHADGIGHIDLGALTGEEILLCAALTGHLMNEGDGLGLGGEEIVVLLLRDELEHLTGTLHRQLGIAKDDERTDIQIVSHLADGQLTLETRHIEGISSHSSSPFIPCRPRRQRLIALQKGGEAPSFIIIRCNHEKSREGGDFS